MVSVARDPGNERSQPGYEKDIKVVSNLRCTEAPISRLVYAGCVDRERVLSLVEIFRSQTLAVPDSWMM